MAELRTRQRRGFAQVKHTAGTALREDRLPQRESRLLRIARVAVPPAVLLAVGITLWQLVTVLLDIPEYVLPAPSDVWASAVEHRADLLVSTLTTFVPVLIGFGASIVVGIAVGMLMSISKLIERSLYPYAILLQTIPIIAIAPMIVIWFGPGRTAISIIAFIISLFPMISNTVLGLTSTDHNLLNLMRMYHASWFQMMWKLRFPAALPYIMGGMRISAGLAVIGAIVGEFVAGIGGGHGGLGSAITAAALNLQIPYLLANALVAGILGIVVFVSVILLSNFVLGGWHESATRQEN